MVKKCELGFFWSKRRVRPCMGKQSVGSESLCFFARAPRRVNSGSVSGMMMSVSVLLLPSVSLDAVARGGPTAAARRPPSLPCLPIPPPADGGAAPHRTGARDTAPRRRPTAAAPPPPPRHPLSLWRPATLAPPAEESWPPPPPPPLLICCGGRDGGAAVMAACVAIIISRGACAAVGARVLHSHEPVLPLSRLSVAETPPPPFPSFSCTALKRSACCFHLWLCLSHHRA